MEILYDNFGLIFIMIAKEFSLCIDKYQDYNDNKIL